MTKKLTANQYREPIEEGQSSQEALSAPAGSPVEQEILALEKQLAQKRAEQKKSVEEAIGFEQAKTAASTAVAPTSNATVPQPSQTKADADKISSYEKDQQIKSLVDLAFAKGVAHATEVVRQLDSPYLMDEFHDTLIDEFHKKLVDEGKLEEI